MKLMKDKTTARIVYEACKELALTVRNYSGRGMYGKECLGFTVACPLSEIAHLSAVLARQESLLPYEHYDLFEGVEQDSMGREYIVYFPKLKWSDVGIGDE